MQGKGQNYFGEIGLNYPELENFDAMFDFHIGREFPRLQRTNSAPQRNSIRLGISAMLLAVNFISAIPIMQLYFLLK